MEAQAGGRHLEILLLHELSSGTFARLYLAEARAPGGIERIVAVKILREQWNESTEVINRTRDEARLLARLRHKNILRVEDLTEIDGQLAIIMEFVDGLDLKQLVEALAKKGQKVPPRAAIQIAAEAASALEAAYFKVPYGLDAPLHVVHRDIKPSNVMVSVEGELKVLDFGTARSSQAFRSVQTGALRFGSLKYMSPERREGDRGEHSADVYALGLMLLEILKGEWLPLLSMDVEEHDETVAEEVSRLGALGMPNREWDIALRQVLLQMLSGEPSVRPNAEQVSKLLRAFAEQASGETLETFAEATVAPIAKQMRGGLNGGALAGTRFVVNWSPADNTVGGKQSGPVAEQLSGAGTPRMPAAVPARAVPVSPAPAAAARAPYAFADEDEQPTYAGVPAGMSTPPSPARTSYPSPASQTHVPPVEVSHANRPRRHAPAAEPPFDPPGEDGAATGGGGMAMVAGGAFVLFAFGCAGLLGVGAVYGYLSASGTADVPATIVSAPPQAPAAATSATSATSAATAGTGAPSVEANVGTAPLSVKMEGSPVQWIRVHTVLGQVVISGEDALQGTLSADTYELSLKQVGRPAMKGTVAVPTEGLSLVCSPGKDATVTCSGATPPLVLKP
ncbi:MAG: serine/threonine-protein kinase [Pseudomonadota bacterium]|nr:serine/threonine-protein kinase [Pseudomonadota bacterium]